MKKIRVWLFILILFSGVSPKKAEAEIQVASAIPQIIHSEVIVKIRPFLTRVESSQMHQQIGVQTIRNTEQLGIIICPALTELISGMNFQDSLTNSKIICIFQASK